jgi:DNA-binding transcriptional LysR family regulator
MELRHLRCFVAVAEELSFTKAAQKIRLARPSLTRQMRILEEEIGVRLMDRSHNRVALTEEGKRFLFDARKLLTMCAESVIAVQRMSHGESIQLNIGYVANLHYSLLPATLGAFRKLYPTIALNLFDMTRPEQYLAIESHKIDLGFIGLPPNLSNHNLLSESVAHDTIVVALPAGHPLVKKPQLSLIDLMPLFFISMSDQTHPGERKWLLETCQGAGFSGSIIQEAGDEATAIRFVAHGLGVFLVPAQVAALPHDGVDFLPLFPALTRASNIAWRADNLSKPLKDYIRIVKNLSYNMLPPAAIRSVNTVKGSSPPTKARPSDTRD